MEGRQMSGHTPRPPLTFREKAAQFVDDAVGVIGFVLAAAFMAVTAWLQLGLRDSWMFGWLPF